MSMSVGESVYRMKKNEDDRRIDDVTADVTADRANDLARARARYGSATLTVT